VELQRVPPHRTLAPHRDSPKGHIAFRYARDLSRRALVIVACNAGEATADAGAAAADITSATEPLPKESDLRLQPAYTFVSDGGSAGEILARARIVYRGLLWPGLGPDDVVSGVRIDLPLDRSNVGGARATGLGKIDLLQISGLRNGNNAVGIGVAIVLPTATD